MKYFAMVIAALTLISCQVSNNVCIDCADWKGGFTNGVFDPTNMVNPGEYTDGLYFDGDCIEDVILDTNGVLFIEYYDPDGWDYEGRFGIEGVTTIKIYVGDECREQFLLDLKKRSDQLDILYEIMEKPNGMLLIYSL